MDNKTPEQIAAEAKTAAGNNGNKTPEQIAAEAKAAAGNKTPEQITAEAKAAAGNKTPEQITAEAKAAAENAVPDRYEFQLGEGVKLDESLMQKFTPIAKQLGLSNGKAQQLAQMYLAHQNEIIAAQQKASDDQIIAWQKTISSDPGSKLLLANAARALSVLDKDTQTWFKSNPYFTDNPLAIRALAKWGATLKEDDLAEGSRVPGAAVPDARVMYAKSGMNP